MKNLISAIPVLICVLRICISILQWFLLKAFAEFNKGKYVFSEQSFIIHEKE